MNITIYGVGAIGLWLGTQLGAQRDVQGTRPAHRISAVARGATLAALREHGMVLHTGGTRLQSPVHATDSPAELGLQDLVVVCVKSPSMASVAAAIAPLLGPQTVVLSAMNGVPWWFLQDFGGALAGRTLQSVDPGGAIAAQIAPQHVVGCVVHASCSSPAPGLAQHHFGNGLIIGEPSGQATPRVAALQTMLAGAGFAATVSQQIQKDIWYKLWGNMTMNPISAITGATTDRILADDLVRGFVSAVMLEAKTIGAQIGIPIAQAPQDRHAVTAKLGAFKTSMLQDVEAGKAIELDALVGAVRELAQLTGTPAPNLDALMGLARLHGRVRGLYPA